MKLCFELPQNVTMSNVLDYYKYSHKWGKVGPFHLLSENGDLSFLLFFSETVLDREHSEKASKNSSAAFISEESSY